MTRSRRVLTLPLFLLATSPVSMHATALFLIAALCCVAYVQPVQADETARVTAYPGLGGPAAELFKVSVDGVDVPVVKIADNDKFGHLARFAMAAPVTVTIRVTGDAPKAVMLRPRRAGIEPTLTDGVLTFRMAKPENLYIKLDGQPDLHVLVYAPVQAPSGDKVFSATADYKIDNTGKTEALPAIQKALADIAGKGGGTLVFSDGIYDCGITTDVRSREFSPGSNTTMFLMPGAMIRQMRILIDEGENIRFEGHGVLDFTGGPGGRQAGCLRVNRVKGLHIRDLVSINRTWNWNTRFDRCNNVTIANYKIFGSKDGIDPVSSSNVDIRNVHIFSADDTIAAKAFNGGSFENVLVENATLLCYSLGGIKIGTETNAEFIRNITFRNIEIIRAARPAILQIRDGARVSNVLMENIIVDSASEAAIDFVIGDARQKRGHIDGVVVRNFVVHRRAEKERIRLAGYDENFMIRNVKFEGLVIEGKPILKFEDIPNVEAKHNENVTFHAAP
jgi:hypothetical protein